jgi:outer membrane protein assembly complex protein YaeT
VGVLLAALLWAAPLPAQGPLPTPPPKATVSDVIVQGNRLISTQEIQSMLKTRVGSEYQEDVVQEDVRALYATRKIGNVEAVPKFSDDHKEVKVYFNIRDYHSVVKHVIYKGRKHLSEDDIATATGIRPGVPMNPMNNRIACQTIKRKLNDQGRPFAECLLDSGGDPNDTDVIFNITEGSKVHISDIDFTGNAFVTKSVLKTHLNSGAWWFHSFGGNWNSAMIDADISKLMEYYRAFGYLDIRIGRELEWATDGKTVVLVFHIVEGRRYQIRETPMVYGAHDLPHEELEQIVRVKGMEYYSEDKVKKDVDGIKDWYGAQGRNTKVEAIPVWDKDNPGILTLRYQVKEEQPVRVGQIFIIGNDRTKQNVILRQLNDLYPGQILSYPAMRQDERNLAKLGIFEATPENHPTITEIVPDNKDCPFHDIRVDVSETNTGSLLFGVGVNSDAGLTGSIVLNEKNFDISNWPTSFDQLFSGGAFRGAGQELRIEAVPGTQLQRYTVSFREPYLFDSLFSLGVSGYYYERMYNEDNEDRIGARVTIGRKLNQYWTASLATRVEGIGIHDVLSIAPPDYTEVVGDHFLVGLRAALTRDDRDSYLRPTEGSLFDVSFEQCFGSFTFPLVNVDYSKYFTIWQRPDGSGRQVLALHSQASWAGDNTPVYERYFAGGFSSMRGFEFRGVGPFINGYNVGGDFMFLNSAEYQIPVLANDNFYMVGFVDTGTVEPKIDLNNYRVSVGFGARFIVPMLGPVPIALDFGFPIVKASGDRTQVFSFWLGFFK